MLIKDKLQVCSGAFVENTMYVIVHLFIVAWEILLLLNGSKLILGYLKRRNYPLTRLGIAIVVNDLNICCTIGDGNNDVLPVRTRRN